MRTASPEQPLDVLGLILRHAEEVPGHPALVDDEERLTYAGLAEGVRATAAGLSERGIGPGHRVALLLPNSAGFVTAALACQWAGAAFVPMSVESPPVHAARILADCALSLVITTDGRLPDDLAVELWASGTVPEVSSPNSLASSSGTAPARATAAGRDVYLIYTSGTTGVPKGVRISAHAFATAVDHAVHAMELDRSARSMSISSFHFDGSYGTLFPTLAVGGTLFVPPRAQLLFLRRFFKTLATERITHTSSSPTYLRMVLDSPLAPQLKDSALRCWALGGEELGGADVARLWKWLPRARVINRYGPTETTIAVTHYAVKAEDVAAKLSIGTPHPGTTFHVVSPDDLSPVLPGDVGELYIGGPQLMSGYWGDPELSAAVLRTDVVAGATVYKTGDLVYQDQAGRYFFSGRADDVVKRSGYRISLAEIATVLRGTDGVRAAECVAIETEGRLGIAAFIEGATALTPRALRESLGTTLPVWMMPDVLMVVPSLPVTPAGKVDRSALALASGLKPWGKSQ